MSTEALDKYLELEKKLHEIRIANHDVESKEEDDVLDEMDVVWFGLTSEEIEQLGERFDDSKR